MNMFNYLVILFIWWGKVKGQNKPIVLLEEVVFFKPTMYLGVDLEKVPDAYYNDTSLSTMGYKSGVIC